MIADSPLAALCHPSPNHGERIGGPADAIILHYTGMATGAAALDLLCSPASQVSCHYLVWEDGRVFQLVPEARRAWHAGPELLGRRDRHELALDRHRDRQSRP